MTSVDQGFGSFAVVDVETSGLSHGTNRVLSIAVSMLSPDGRVDREFHTLVDPGCDPGPVHVHGLTREVLSGAPRFEAVRDELAEHLDGRVMVAHNASFDYGFLVSEFRRAGMTNAPIGRRMCTLAFARRIALPTEDCKLSTLARHYGVGQDRAHDARDDVRVLVGVLRGLMADGARLGIAPPTLVCPPKEGFAADRGLPPPRRNPKVPCRFVYPGRLQTGGALQQGMKIAFTGDTVSDRNALLERAEAQGLDVTGAVSRKTSVLVTNSPGSGTSKARRAADYGTPVVSETRFQLLLNDVRPGIETTAPAAKKQSRSDDRPTTTPSGPTVATGPLAGRRILVVGGSHEAAAEWRQRITELGGAAAVNMSASVTDVLRLGAVENDRRLGRARKLGIPIHDELPVVSASNAESPTASDEAILRRGQTIDLPVGDSDLLWTIRASWKQEQEWDVDVVAFLVDDDELVSDDDDFVFYNQPQGAGVALSTDGPSEQSITVAPGQLAPHCRKVVVCAALQNEDVAFGDVGAIEIEVSDGEQSRTIARATLDAATTERTMVLAELYMRGERWRVRAVGQGYDSGLADLAVRYGVDVDE